MPEPSPYTSPSFQENHPELHDSRIPGKFRVRFVPAILLFVLGLLLVIWGVVAFCLSFPNAAKLGTLAAYVKWCGSSVLVGIVGSIFAASGFFVAKAKIAVALAAILLGIVALFLGSFLLLPYILDGP